MCICGQLIGINMKLSWESPHSIDLPWVKKKKWLVIKMSKLPLSQPKVKQNNWVFIFHFHFGNKFITYCANFLFGDFLCQGLLVWFGIVAAVVTLAGAGGSNIADSRQWDTPPSQQSQAFSLFHKHSWCVGSWVVFVHGGRGRIKMMGWIFSLIISVCFVFNWKALWAAKVWAELPL